MDRVGINATHRVERYGKATIHSLRDTFASRLVSQGISLYDLQMLLGHASPTMTQKYAHLSVQDSAKRAVKVLDELHAA